LNEKGQISGTAGSSLAIATANASGNALALPSAETGLGRGGIAVGFGRAVGAGGGVTANGFGVNTSGVGQAGKVRAYADAPVPAAGMGAVQGQAQAGIAASPPKPNTTLNAFASGIGDPRLADVLAASAGHSNVISALQIGHGGVPLGLVELAGRYPTIASGASAVYSSSVDFQFDPTKLSGSDIRVGLLSGSAFGSGFDSLVFEILVNGTMVDEQKFSSVTSASNYFDDHVLDLGPLGAGSSGSIDVQFALDVTAHRGDDGYGVDFAMASSVPEPSTESLVVTGALIWLTCTYVARRRRRTTRA
jgi:hypothetical protein